MAKITFNSFEFLLAEHPESFSFTGTVASGAPKGLSIDNGGKKMPTPYELFHKWATVSLSGDWVSKKYKGGFVICVAEMTDATLISHTFGTVGTLRKTGTGERNVTLGYSDADYRPLAKKLGYDI